MEENVKKAVFDYKIDQILEKLGQSTGEEIFISEVKPTKAPEKQTPSNNVTINMLRNYVRQSEFRDLQSQIKNMQEIVQVIPRKNYGDDISD